MTIDNRLEARYRSIDMDAPVLLATADDVDHLIDSLLTAPPRHDAVILHSRARPKIRLEFFDHELCVGVDRDTQLGSMTLVIPEEDRIAANIPIPSTSGNNPADSSAPPPGECNDEIYEEERISSVGIPGSRSGISHHVADYWTEFSDDSEISIDLIREAIKEFLSSGGKIPNCVQWKPFELADEGVDGEAEIWGNR